MEGLLFGNTKKSPELYQVLNCDRTSSHEQIVTEYRAKVRDCHPDKAGNEANDSFVTLKKAFDILSDPKSRKLYDTWLENPLPMKFEEFMNCSETIKQSMHWVTPKSTPQITSSQNLEASNQSSPLSKWKEGRYESKTAKKFRNYEI